MVQPEDDFHTKGTGIFTVHVHSKNKVPNRCVLEIWQTPLCVPHVGSLHSLATTVMENIMQYNGNKEIKQNKVTQKGGCS